MGEWYEVKTMPYRDDPCFGCQCGSCGVSQKLENGKLYEKFDGCTETCLEYKEYLARKSEPFFGEHIREVYHAIIGK